MKRLKVRHKMQQLHKQGIFIDAQMLKACYGKIRYETFEKAKEKCLIGCEVYRCKFCKKYHFGHSPKN